MTWTTHLTIGIILSAGFSMVWIEREHKELDFSKLDAFVRFAVMTLMWPLLAVLIVAYIAKQIEKGFESPSQPSSEGSMRGGEVEEKQP